MQTLLKRSIFGLVYVTLFIAAILYSKESYFILIGVFSLLCLWEFSKMILLQNIIPYLVLIASALYFIFKASENRLLFLLIVTLICSFTLIFYLFSKKGNYPNKLLNKIDVCIRYIIFPFSFLMILPIQNQLYKPNLIIYILVLIWINDTFAFLVGKYFGKRKLFKRVSPKKTIEGFLGGLFFTIITGAIIGYQDKLGILNWLILALIISVIGTLGDLVESKFKRQANIKDSGKLIPGHGGMLDRLDSLLFATPFVYLYVHYII